MSYERGALLLQTGRHDMAEKEFRAALSHQPNDARSHAMLAFCLARRQAYTDATDAARQAITLMPNFYMGYSAMAYILSERGYFKEAIDAVNQAIQMDSGNPNHCGRLAEIKFKQRDWAGALAAADRGLQLDPNSSICVNVRGMALVQMGQKAQASATIAGALAKDPQNAVTHANQGWAMLHKHDHRAALEHFREALRIDPELQWAKAGMVEAIKAKNPIYGIMLRYFLFMSRLSHRTQWFIIIGAWVGYQVLRAALDAYPALGPVVVPLMIAYVAFVLLTWMAAPLFNLLLRVSRFGRYALSRDQRVASNWLGGCLALATVLATIGIFWDFRLILIAVIVAALSIPITLTYAVAAGPPRRIMAGYSALLGLLGAADIFTLLAWNTRNSAHLDLTSVDLLLCIIVGVTMTSWIVNFVRMMRVKR